MKKYFPPLILGVSLFLIIFFVGQFYYEFLQEIREMRSPLWTWTQAEIKVNFLALLFGFLIEWNGLKAIFNRKIKVNWLMIPAVLLMILGFIPIAQWQLWFGVAWTGLKHGTIHALAVKESHIMVMILAGVLLVRSITPASATDESKTVSESKNLP
ncbi:MAG: hypothetical protein APF84_02455 [Gracilibacter sp. BRH_c7a]|nr:MAG: hypothetical protein APF84_02455 [Gracilibacter sp. BRH_c7a]